MATVKLADVIDVEIYQAIEPENRPEQTAFFESGVVVRSPAMDALAVEEAELVNLPFWRDLDPTVEPNYSLNDDSSASPSKIVQGRMKAKRASLNNGWSVRDLTNEMTMGDMAMTRIKARTSQYWQWQLQRRIIAIAQGVYNANIRGSNAGVDAGFGVTNDMVIDISTNNTTATPITDVHLFDADAFIDARFTLGDAVDSLSAVCVHSVIRKRMQSLDLIEYFRDSDSNKTIELYQGHRLIVDDSCPVIPVGTGAGFRYLTILFGAAMFAYGEGTPTTPVEIDRNPAIGNGAGEETLWERKTWLIHPFGHSNENATNTAGELSGGAGNGLWQTLADCRLGTNWKRNYFRKNVPMAFLVTNG